MECQKDEHESLESQVVIPRQSKGTGFLRTCFNGVNALSGVGILSIPYALSQGGWLSLIILLVVAVICYYTAILLKECLAANPLIKTYPDIGEFAFGSKGRAIVSIFLYLELYFVAVEFLILEGDNLEKMFPKAGLHMGGLKIGAKQGFVLLSALVILPTTWVRSLGVLAYVSAGGVLASGVLTCCVLVVGVVDDVGFRERGKLLNVGGLPSAISLFAFCYCGHAVFPTIVNSMKDRSQFPKVLLVCFIATTINYSSMAILGYLMYGQTLKSQITLNLPTTAVATHIAVYTTLINPLTKYAVIISPIATAIEEVSYFKNSRILSVIIRTAILVSTVVVALTVPFFGYVMAFTGAFLGITVSVLAPCLCYLKIKRVDLRFGVELVFILGILVVSVFVGVIGTITSLRQIVSHL